VMAFAGILYKTVDGGETWSSTAITQPPGSITNSAGKGTIWSMENNLWVALSGNGVAYSPDFGLTWSLPSNTGLNFGGYCNISFSNPYFGISVKQNSPYVYVTKDGAESWTVSVNTLGANQDVLAYNGDLWFIPNPADHFYIKHSADSGATWQQELVDAAGFEILEKSRNGNTLWAGTDKGTVYVNHLPIISSTAQLTTDPSTFRFTPNPTGDQFTFYCDLNECFTLSVYDETGRLVMQLNDLQRGTVFGSNLPSGVFLAKVSNSKRDLTVQRLIKIMH
jgi:hypothetical protein